MRTFAWVVLFAVLSVHVSFAGAQQSASPTPTQADAKAKAEAEAKAKAAEEAAKQTPPTAQLVEPKKTFKMGDTVRVKVEGSHQIMIEQAKAKEVWLVLDDVVFTSIDPPSAVKDKVGKGLILSFRLFRDPDKFSSRDEWKKLLEKQHDGPLMTLPIHLAIGKDAALPVSSDEFKFYITTKGRVLSTIFLCLAIFGVVYWWLLRNKNALRDYPNGTYSLGKSQMAFWGLLVILAFLGIYFNTTQIEHIPQQVLIVLGISGATGLGALVIGNGTKAAEITKLEEELKKLSVDDKVGRDANEIRLNELRNPPTSAIIGFTKFFQDICSDGNGMSFHRLQAVMWTAILGVMFVFGVAQVISMQEFSTELMILMGISNVIYLGFKFPEKP